MFGGDLDTNHLLGVALGSRAAITRQYHAAVFYGLVPLVTCMLIRAWIPQRRMASFFTSAGLVYCSAALVVFSRGSIEAHFDFL